MSDKKTQTTNDPIILRFDGSIVYEQPDPGLWVGEQILNFLKGKCFNGEDITITIAEHKIDWDEVLK